MVGLRTQENTKFLEFWKIVQKVANAENKIFFLDCGEGHVFENDWIECEDLTGWLIPNELSEAFNKEFIKSQVSDKWTEFLVALSWKITDGNISVQFEDF